jgi:hypothetical protein
MKWWAILVFGILLSSYVLAEDVTLGLGESYVYNGVNITFAKIDYKNNKILLCANNQKQILEEDQLTYFENKSGENFMEIEVNHIDTKDRTIDIDIGWVRACDGIYCECVGDCSNNECTIQMYDEWGSPLIKENKTEELVEEKPAEEIKEPIIENEETPNYIMIISIIIIIGGLVGLMAVWLFWFR